MQLRRQVSRIAAPVWNRFRGTGQWYALWLTNPTFMVGVSGVITDETGRVLLLQHRFWDAGTWGLPSGYMKRRESPEQAVAREVREETQLEASIDELIMIKGGFKLRLEMTYRGTVRHGPIALDEAEVLAADFFNHDQLPEGLLPTHRDLIHSTLN